MQVLGPGTSIQHPSQAGPSGLSAIAARQRGGLGRLAAAASRSYWHTTFPALRTETGLRSQDSNLDSGFQRALCCHYTTPQ